jgi:DNA polymerase-1
MTGGHVKVLIIDGYNMLHRARVVKNLGQYGIAFNFLRMLRSTVDSVRPDVAYFVVEGDPQWRKQLMGEYKANRVIAEDDPRFEEMVDFQTQKRICIEIIRRHIPIVLAYHPDNECDDVVYTLATRTHAADEIVILSSDSDFTQLVTGPDESRVKLLNPIKGSQVEWPGFDYVRWKALRGDLTDNIPGLPGIGDKRAAALVQDAAKLDKLLQDPALREQFDRNLKLIQLRDVEEEGVPMELTRGDGNWEEVKGALGEMQMASMVTDTYWPKFTKTFDRLQTPGGVKIIAP